MSAQVWVVGAGKGGVGKTFISSSLGITLAKLNHKVLLIDFDISGANLHTTFGLSLNEKNLRLFFEEGKNLADLAQETEIPKLSYVQGFWDYWSNGVIHQELVKNLFEQAEKVNYDYVIFDLGAGPLPAHLELFKIAHEKILIANAEPTSLEKTYRFIESFICHKLKDYMTKDCQKTLQVLLREYRKTNHNGCFSFRDFLIAENGINIDHFDMLNERPLKLLMNGCRSNLDKDLGFSIKSVCKKYYDLNIEFIGSVDFDNAVWQSVRNREPVLIEKPFTPLAGQFLSITKDLITPEIHANLFKEVV